ncbi:hypothetical protein B0H63DRAFT_449600 [Podospora didyma]|uniref:C2H2-type domain-containing protein n=1 Tax=Podospora didyma TaxID=330526 RepID=A0AAE0NPY6_9PEZI|nr:hypothetical protein B0H63DRAFT_449600 [Podospora didyma]
MSQPQPSPEAAAPEEVKSEPGSDTAKTASNGTRGGAGPARARAGPPTQQRKPLPASPPQPSPPRFRGKLPPIASLLPPAPRYAPPSQSPRPLRTTTDQIRPHPHPNIQPRPPTLPKTQQPPSRPHARTSPPSPGHLARPAGMDTSPSAPRRTMMPLMQPPIMPDGLPTVASLPPGPPPDSPTAPPAGPVGQYHEFSVRGLNDLKTYAVTRTGKQERAFKCDLCTQSFSRNHDLKRHRRIHLAAKPYPCPTCDKCFSRKDALKRHRLVKACADKKTPPPTSQSGGAVAEPAKSAEPDDSDEQDEADEPDERAGPDAATESPEPVERPAKKLKSKSP